MKKKLTYLMTTILLSTSAFSSDYNIIISKDNNNYNHSEYIETGNVFCEEKQPLVNEVYKGREFNQENKNCKKEIKNKSEEYWPSTPNFQTTETGTLLLLSCKEIIEQGHSIGSGDYNSVLNGSEELITCDMEKNGGGWTLSYQKHFVGVENGPVKSVMYPAVQLFSDLNAESTMIDLENRWFSLDGLTNEEFAWMWNSGNGHESRNIASEVITSTGKKYNGNEVVWQHWTSEIYQLNKNSGVWDTNTIFDLGNDSNHGASFWDNADGIYKRLGGYQTPINVTLSIYVR